MNEKGNLTLFLVIMILSQLQLYISQYDFKSNNSDLFKNLSHNYNTFFYSEGKNITFSYRKDVS